MALIILIPAFACWFVLARSSARQALLDVYLPALLLLPQYYVLRLPHTPPMSFSDMAILPIGFAMIFGYIRRWRLDWMDLWVLLYAASCGLSEGLSNQLANGDWVYIFSANSATSDQLSTNLANGALMFIGRVLSMVLPYMAGKLLIEGAVVDGQPMRKKLVERLLTLLAIVAVISVFDFLTKGSIWQKVIGRFFPTQDVGWIPQSRWGFGRIQGPFGHAILAGMIFLIGFSYCLWLRRVYPDWGTRKIFQGSKLTVRGLLLGAIVAGLLMAQSRGPWIGVGLALVFGMLMRAMSAVKAAAVFLAFLSLFSIAAYYYGKQYTDRDMNQASNEEQRNAIYRRQLLENYFPLVRERKAFGWGVTDYPKINGQISIDNQYLLLAVTQGFVGLGFFLLIAAGTGLRLLRMLSRPLQPDDRLLVFAHLSVLIGLLTTLSTVYMGEQVVMLFFLIAGWVQGMHPQSATVQALGAPAQQQLRFRRVLV
jgi:O-antigen ligase